MCVCVCVAEKTVLNKSYREKVNAHCKCITIFVSLVAFKITE